jgi:hypothetical protein
MGFHTALKRAQASYGRVKKIHQKQTAKKANFERIGTGAS